jgi:heme-degrading monooxygenase HmoA
MITALAILKVFKDKENQFEEDFKIAGQYISAIDGYIKHSLSKCIEEEGKYMLLVEWENLEAHTVGFKTSSEYLEWKKLLHHYYSPFPVVEHYKTIIEVNSQLF